MRHTVSTETAQDVASTNLNRKPCNSRVTHTHTQPFNGPLSGTARVSRYQKGKTNLDFTEARDRKWQWHQLGHMPVCTSLQTDNHASTPTTQFFTGWMLFLAPNKQRQSTEGISTEGIQQPSDLKGNSVMGNSAI